MGNRLMRVNFDYATNEIVVRLTDLEADRLTAIIHRETQGMPDPQNDKAGQLEDALTELFS
jgi:hypothetical protein